MYEYKTKGTCSQMIYFDIDDNKVKNVQFLGGCNGNLKGIGKLVEGMDVDEVIARTEGIDCEALVQSGELPVFEKYDEYIPADLLRRAYAADRLRSDEVVRRLGEMLNEF